MITAKKRSLHITLLLLVGSCIAAHLCFWLLPSVFETWNAKTIDRLFLFRSSVDKLRPQYDDTIVHVDLNTTSLQQLNNFYLNRSHHAKLIRTLKAMNVSTQLYDFIFAAPSNDEEDRALIDATEQAGNVYFGLAFELVNKEEQQPNQPIGTKKALYLDRTKWQVGVKGDSTSLYSGTNPLITFPALASASQGLGYLSLKFDRDGVFRRLPLLVRYKGAFYPSFSFRAICDYLSVPPDKIIIKPGKTITLHDVRRPGEGEGHDIVIPIDQYGNMVVNFIGPWERMKHYNFADVLVASEDRDEMEMWKKELSGKIVVVSEVLTGSSDAGPVPTDTNFPLSGLHANAIHTILTESFLRELSEREMLLIEVVLLAIVLFLSLRFSSPYFTGGSFLLAGSYIVIASLSFFYGQVIFHMVRPILMIAFAIVAIVVYRYIQEEREKMESLRQRDFIRDTFGRYLSNEVVEELLGSPEGLNMSGEIREVTFLVSDLRDFTALSMRLSPHEVINILNRYLDHMVEIITDYRGTINEIEGDGILAFFGAPLSESDDPERAVACAIAMQNAMVALNAEQRHLKLPELAMGIGINSGDVVVGNIGSEKRAKYSAIGSPINAAYRIESYTVGGQILISPSTYERVKSLLRVHRTMDVQFKGIDHPVTLYDVTGMEGTYELSLPEKVVYPLVKLESPVPITCFPIKGKTVSEASISGLITHLGESAIEVSLDQQVEAHSNVKVLLTPKDSPGLAEVYAKVVSVEPSESTSSHIKARLEFTWIPEEVKSFLVKKRSSKP